MLVDRGRIVVDPSIDQWRLRVLGLGVQEIPLTGDIAIAAVHLADLHGDPADRIIVATGVATGATLSPPTIGSSGGRARSSAKMRDGRRPRHRAMTVKSSVAGAALRQDGCARSALVYGIENVASAGSGGIAASHAA